MSPGQGAIGEEEMWLLCTEEGALRPHCASRGHSLKACTVSRENRDPPEILDWASFF